MRPMLKLAALMSAAAVSACAGVASVMPPAPSSAAWAPVEASTRSIDLGLPGGARLADGVRFAGGLHLVSDAASPLHSLSDLKLIGDELISVSDVGDLVQARPRLDRNGRLVGLDHARARRLTGLDGHPISEKVEGDAEGLTLTASGDLLVSFERDHRIWDYGPLTALRTVPAAVAHPDYPFPRNDGMEGLATTPDGWRVAGESGGVWDCRAVGCVEIAAPPEPLLPDTEYRITGMDRDPAGAGWFVVQRLYRPPIDSRAQIRRMAPEGTLGPVLVTLRLPGTTDNFEGIAAVRRGDGVRLYILSDDNFSAMQRTLLLAFDVAD